MASVIQLAAVKQRLKVFHTSDDADIQRAIESAEGELIRYTGRTQLPTLPLDYPPEYDSSSSEISEDVPSSEDPVAPEVFDAVCLLVRASYEGLDAAEIAGLRRAALAKMEPFRAGLGA
jgi:hypothetical protein